MKISIHTPTKGVTGGSQAQGEQSKISIHTPTKGVTKTNRKRPIANGNFNPHSHEGSDSQSITQHSSER